MIYLKNNTETQAIYIPRQTVLGGGYIPSTKAYDKGYNDGLEDGKEQQKGKLSNLNVTENGQYEREDGWNVVTVDVPDLNGSYSEGYEQGKADGIDEQKGKLESINIIENGVYSKEDGYNHIEVNVPDLNGSYDEGYAEGERVGYNQGKADVVANASDIEVTKNGQYGDGKTLYKTINVNVVPKVNVQKEGIKFAFGTFTEVPEWADFKGVTDMISMFNGCSNLQTIPLIDTSNVTDMSSMFSDCRNLQAIPLIDTSNVTDMRYMFKGCSNLQTIPLIDTSNVTNMIYIFSDCNNLQTIPPLNTSKVIKAPNMFERCFALISIPALDFRALQMDSYDGFFGWYDLTKLTDFGGFLNLKCSLTNDKNLQRLPNLTYESCINVLNGLYDFTGNGETPSSGQGQLKVHQNFLDKVGDEISIGVAKGWTITA